MFRFRLASLIAACLAASAPLWPQPLAYVTALDGSVYVIDTESLMVTKTIGVGADPSGVVAGTNLKRVFVTNQSDNTVSVINTASGAVNRTIAVGSFPVAVALTPDETRLYVALFGQQALQVIRPQNGTTLATIPLTEPPICIVTDGIRAHVTGFGSTLSVIDVATNTVLDIFDLEGAGAGMALSADGFRLYVALVNRDVILVINARSLAVIGRWRTGAGPFGVSLAGDDQRLYVSDQLGDSVSVFDTTNGNPLGQIPVGDRPTGLAVTPNGERLLVANRGSDSVTVIDTATLAVIATIPVGRSPIAFGAFIESVPARGPRSH